MSLRRDGESNFLQVPSWRAESDNSRNYYVAGPRLLSYLSPQNWYLIIIPLKKNSLRGVSYLLKFLQLASGGARD